MLLNIWFQKVMVFFSSLMCTSALCSEEELTLETSAPQIRYVVYFLVDKQLKKNGALRLVRQRSEAVSLETNNCALVERRCFNACCH